MGVKKPPFFHNEGCSQIWSGRQDLNLRPSVPKTDAIPSYATSRFGAPDKNRTRNLLVRSQTLYPVELQAHRAR